MRSFCAAISAWSSAAFALRHREFGRGLQALLALGDERRLQGGDVVGKGFKCGSHEGQRIIFRAICGALKCLHPHAFCESPAFSARARRPPGELRIAPVDPLQHVGHLRR